jgi:hypothetical protein
MDELGKLSEERGKIWRALEDDLWSDEDHAWRAEQCRKMAKIEMEVHRFEDDQRTIATSTPTLDAIEDLLGFEGSLGTGEELAEFLEDKGWTDMEAIRFVNALHRLESDLREELK